MNPTTEDHEVDATRSSEPSSAPEDFDVLEVLVVGAATTAGVAAGIGLVLAMLGAYSATVVLLATAVLAIGGFALVLSPIGRQQIRLRWSHSSLIVILVIGLVSWWNAHHVGQPMAIRRDPGSYAATARWIARSSGLRVESHGEVLPDVGSVVFSGPAVYDVGNGLLEFQFSHGSSVVMATASEIAGPRGIFLANVALVAMGLLAVYLVARRLRVPVALAVAATTALSISVPFLYITRSTYSEPWVLLAVWAGVLLLVSTDPLRADAIKLTLAAFLIGSTVLYRVDGLLYVAAFCLALSAIALGGDRRRPIVAAILIGAVPVGIGLVDQHYFTGFYASDLRTSILQLVALALLSLLVLFAATVLGSARPLGTHDAVLSSAPLVGGVASLALTFLWLVRPQLLSPRVDGPKQPPSESLVAGLQSREGLEIDSTRTFAELSVAQIDWYFGVPTVALGIAGFGIIMARGVRMPSSRWGALALFLLVSVPLYIWRPSIFPDHPWLTRRFVPGIYPAFLVAAAVTGTWVSERVRTTCSDRGRVGVISVLCALVIVPPALTTWPIRDLTDQRGAYGGIVEVCRIIPEDAAVLTLGTAELSMALRAWCGADVGTVDPNDLVAVQRFASLSRERCTDAFLVGTGDALLGHPDFGTEPSLGIMTPLGPGAELTLSRPPTRTSSGFFELWISESRASC